jgi:hypothetical protein
MDVDAFIATVEDMRYWQRRFFRAKQGSSEKLEAVRKAKDGERKVDAMLAELRTSQPKLQGIVT